MPPHQVYTEAIVMASDNQYRLLLLLKLLYEQTDEDHYVSVTDILQYWEKEGIHAN